MPNCERCGIAVNEDELHEHLGQTLCDDCYMDALNPPKGCDPWAVYTAKRSMGKRTPLTPLQEKIIESLREEGPLKPSDLQERLEIGETQLKREFATLRHMELARATKKGQEVYWVLFDG